MRDYEFTVLLEVDEDGVFIASCPALQGCHSFGATRDEALVNLKDAMRLHIEARTELGEPVPTEYAIERIRISA